MVHFYGWGSTASGPLCGGSLISTTKFPEMHGTTLEVKAESNLEPPSGTLEAIAP